MTSFNIYYVFDRRKKASKQNFGVVELCISFGRQGRLYENTGIELYPPQWDSDNQLVIGSGAKLINRQLYRFRKDIEAVLVDMQRKGLDVTVESYRAYKSQEECMDDFFDFAYECMADRKMEDGTRAHHVCAIEALRESKCVRMISDLTADNIARFDLWLRERKPDMAQTTLHNYHKRIKVYVNEAIKRRLLDVSPYDKFKDVRGRSKDRVALTEEELVRIRELNIFDKSTEKARDVFVFCCYTGLAYADANKLTPDMMVKRGGRVYISSDRKKTGSHYYTPMLPPAKEVWDKYDGKLPMYSQQTYNRMLKIVGQLAGIQKPMTSHIARHTFATTVILANDIPIETLSKMLGHRDIRVTQVYAKILDQTICRHSEKLFERLDK